MELYFLRHGKAVELSPDCPDDFQRELTEEGIEQLEIVAEAFHRLGIRPDCILTSPLIRARQTAEIVARRLGRKKELIETDVLAPGCTLNQLKKLLDEHAPSRSVMLVGHEPDFSALVGELIGLEGAVIEMKKAGLALVEVAGSVRPGGGVLHWLVPPKILTRGARTGARDDE